MDQPILATLGGLVFVAALADAAVSDLSRFRIPNRVPLVLLVAFLPAALAAGMGVEQIGWRLLAALVVFAVCLALFALRLWGGGDAKLVPAVALWLGFAALPRFLVVMAVAGGALALVTLLARRLKLTTASRVPYGVAIAAGGLDWWVATFLPRLTG
jgi:prepilin peptidase CpaA